MRSSHLVVALGMLAAGCATPSGETKVTSIGGWDGRDISELIAVIGPIDKSTAKSDARTYDWYRFSSCKVSANTTPDNKIVNVEMAGTAQGCSSYAQKLSAK